MAYWATRGLRGNTLEELINISNDVYLSQGLAIIQKIPTPIKPVQIDESHKFITKAFFEQKSTVDYIGAVQGIPVCFDAKETSQKNLPLQNIHQHQIEFMSNFQKQRGIAFLLVHFTLYSEFYFLPFEQLSKLERKSIPYSAFDKRLLIGNKNGAPVHYLEALNTYLSMLREGGLKE